MSKAAGRHILFRNMPAKRIEAPRGGDKKIPASVKQYVKSQLDGSIELRAKDIAGSYNLTPTSGPLELNNIPPADRDGAVVNMQDVRLSITVVIPSGLAAGVVLQSRIITFEWFPLSVPTIANLIQFPAASTIINSPLTFATRQFYRVHSDDVVLNTLYDQSAWHKVIDKKLHNSKKRFDDAAVPAATTGLMYVLAVSDSATNSALFNYYRRTLYTDA